MKLATLAVFASIYGCSVFPATAAEISTHVLDLARGTGGKGVPVALSKRSADGVWQQVDKSTTDANGRVRSFDDGGLFDTGVYRLEFDMSKYPDESANPFFPEIVLTFRVADKEGHYHVPVVVSPYGYSTYRGN
ncbi:hydroxyisourate hydrolase [Sphingobium yanoikuyae]|uniref:hydroxyisourate hydrolase n=1 Tax=Sphingobium yanoikuyae TaxID=13690 RepID=UPI0028A1F5B8|nr:hydroxyisourate hydrolase [Sphingobium yanoikuyae]